MIHVLVEWLQFLLLLLLVRSLKQYKVLTSFQIALQYADYSLLD